MRFEHNLPLQRDPGPVCLTIGNFDGVHLGHRALLDHLGAAATREGAQRALITFDPHPLCVLRPDRCPPALTTLAEKRSRLSDLGVERMVVVHFTTEVSAWPAEYFCERLLQAFDLRTLVVGHDFALGHGRQGTVDFLRGYGAEHGFDVEVVDAVVDDSERVSSSRVRAAVQRGDVETARRLCGYPYFIDGHVEHGDRIGTRIGFPTANIAVPAGKCLPARGVYATWMRVKGGWHAAATNVGYRPTFGGDTLRVEAYLLDFDADIYHHATRLAFVSRLRDELTYTDHQALIDQIGADVEETRRRLAGVQPPPD